MQESRYRHAHLRISGKEVLLLPEFELTDFPPRCTLNASDARAALGHLTADITIAGFVEEKAGKCYSSCLVCDVDSTYIVRKHTAYPSEKYLITDSGETPPLLDLSIGKTLLLICADARHFLCDDDFIATCHQQKTENIILVSAWLNGFDWILAAMNNVAQRLDLQNCLIIDRFHGLSISRHTMESYKR